MMKTIKNLIKQIRSNRTIFIASVKSAGVSFAKMLLIYRLEKIRFFRPIVMIFRVFLKWSAYTSMFSLAYSIICKLFHFQYDVTFWFSLAYGVWLVASEGLIDYFFEAYDNIIAKTKNLVVKIYNKFISNPQTIEKANKIKNSNVKLQEIIDKYQEEESIKFKEREAIRWAELENKRLEELDKLRMERYRNKDKSYFNLFGNNETDNLTNSDSQNKTNYWNYVYYGVLILGIIVGGYIAFANYSSWVNDSDSEFDSPPSRPRPRGLDLQTQPGDNPNSWIPEPRLRPVNEDDGIISKVWDKTKEGANKLGSYIPNPIKTIFGKKYGPLELLSTILLHRNQLVPQRLKLLM